MQRNSLIHGDFILYPVEDFSSFTGFFCLPAQDTDRDLDDFIPRDAQRHLADKIAVTYTLSIKETSRYIPMNFDLKSL